MNMKKLLLIITTAFLFFGVVFCQKDCDPIEGLKATFVEDTKTVFLEWEAPTKKLSLSKSIQNEETDRSEATDKESSWFSWCGPFDQIECHYPRIYVVEFNKYDLAALGVVSGNEVTKVRFVAINDPEWYYFIYIYKSEYCGENCIGGSWLEYGQAILETLRDSVYNEILLDIPYRINANYGLRIGVMGRCIAYDAGPAVPYKNLQSSSLVGWGGFPFGNLNIEAFVRDPNQKITYNIYRNDSLIASNLEEMYYIDDATELNLENYEYCVVAVTSTCESERVCQTLSTNSINEYSPTITIYPNPTTGELTISPAGGGKGVEQLSINSVEIFDIYGKCHLSLVTRHETLVTCHSSRVTINISHLHTGIYFVKTSTKAGIVVKKVVKQ